jgi:predicted MPP superfamily phosphohydrolase
MGGDEVAKKPSTQWLWWRWLYGAWAIFLLWGLAIEPALLRRHTHQLLVHKLPVACEGVRVLVAADWHIGSEHASPERIRNIAARMASEKVDMALLPGDFEAHGLFFASLPMSKIAPDMIALAHSAPTFAVLGNHDHFNGRPEDKIRILDENHIHVLYNENMEVALRDGKCHLHLIGIGDQFTGVAVPRLAMEGLPMDGVRIGMAHNPTTYSSVADKVDLFLAGHTHGGVVCVPGTRWCLSRLAGTIGGGEWVSGTYSPKGKRSALLVTNGIGNSIIPFRFGAPPGYDVIELMSTDGGNSWRD